MRNHVVLTVAKGLIVGGTMLVPGVSGGTMAMILGIYDRLVTSVSSFMKHKRQSLFFLALFSAGGLAGMLLFANPLLALIEAYPMPTLYFFLGAVAGGIPVILKQARIERFSWKVPLYTILGLLAILPLQNCLWGLFKLRRIVASCRSCSWQQSVSLQQWGWYCLESASLTCFCSWASTMLR